MCFTAYWAETGLPSSRGGVFLQISIKEIINAFFSLKKKKFVLYFPLRAHITSENEYGFKNDYAHLKHI